MSDHLPPPPSPWQYYAKIAMSRCVHSAKLAACLRWLRVSGVFRGEHDPDRARFVELVDRYRDEIELAKRRGRKWNPPRGTPWMLTNDDFGTRNAKLAEYRRQHNRRLAKAEAAIEAFVNDRLTRPKYRTHQRSVR